MSLALLLAFIAGVLRSLQVYAIGTLRPVSELAVQSSITNISEVSNYVFTFIPDTAVPAGGQMKVTFPQQFATDLGLTSGTPTCSGTLCVRDGRTVTVTLGASMTAGAVSTVTVGSVMNPSLAGGTGPFALVSYKGVNALDMNLSFGVVGIAGAIVRMTTASVRTTTGESSGVGDASRLDFFFRSEVGIKPGNWVRFSFPSGTASQVYQIGTIPTCAPVPVKGVALSGNLSCSLESGKVVLRGIENTIPIGTDISVRISVINPKAAGTTGSFSMETGLANTNTVLERMATIAGLTVTPGQVTGVSLQPLDPQMILSTSRQLQYLLKFTLTNSVAAGGTIKIDLKTDFQATCSSLGAAPSNSYVLYGLNDGAATVQLSCDTVAVPFLITVNNFAAYSKQEVAIVLYLTNPSKAGLTKSLAIYSTEVSTGAIIDQSAIGATVTIASISSPSFSAVSTTANTSASLTITITPSVPIPAQGYIKVRFPDAFTVLTPLPTCTVQPYQTASALAANSCVYGSGAIKAQLYTNDGGSPAVPGDFIAGAASRVTVGSAAQLKTPKMGGTYFLDVSTYDSSSVLLETGTCTVSVSAASMGFSVFPVHSFMDTPVVLKFLFSPTLDIPAGSSAQSPQGFIEISVYAQSSQNFRYDLGISPASTQVPCKAGSGIIPVSGSSLLCSYTTLTSDGWLAITITNFQSISAGTSVSLYLSGLKSARPTSPGPPATVDYLLRTYQTANRLSNNLNSGGYGDSTTLISPGTATAVTQPVATPLAPTVGTTFDLTFSLTTSASAISSNAAFLVYINPTHGAGFCSGTVAVSLTCQVTSATSCSALCHPISDMIVLTTVSPGYAATSTIAFTLKQLMSPPSVKNANDQITVYTPIDTVVFATQLSSSVAAPSLFSVTASNLGANFVNLQYFLYLQTSLSIPASGSAAFSFPAVYSLTSSDPPVRCSVQGVTAATVAGVSCVVAATSVTVTNFLALATTDTMKVTLAGMKNPSATGSAGSFSVTTKNAAGENMNSGTFSGITFSTTFTPGSTAPTVTFSPTNAGVNAVYEVQVNPVNAIGAGGKVEVTFPAQFGSLANTADCKIVSPVSTYQSCSRTGALFSVVLDTDYSPTSPIIFRFSGIPNFASGTSSVFLATTRYDNVILDQNLSSDPAPVVTVTAAPGILAVNKVTAVPNNEGERAEYTFSFTPLLAFKDTDYILAVFPSEYDPLLGSRFVCWATGLQGSLSCGSSSSRTVQVTGHQSFSPCGSCTITLTIRGIVNPPATAATAFLAIGTIRGSQFIEFQSAAGSVAISPAPGLLTLIETKMTNSFARFPNEMFFNITAALEIPSKANQGSIRIVYPQQYLLDNSAISCNSSSVWSNGSPNCTLADDYIKLVGDSAYSGNLNVTVSNVPNPAQAGLADSIVVKTIDEYKQKVLERTYANLQPLQASFSYSGPLIVVNNDQPIIVRSGAFSDLINITVDFPCARNLTLTPVLPDFIISPSTIRLDVGQMSTSFVIGAPVSISSLTNIMLWEIANEVSPAYYTPIQKTVVLLNNVTVLQVRVEDIPEIPIGGKSLPFKVWVNYAPVNDLEVEMALSSELNGATIVQSTLLFKSGETAQYGQILASLSSSSSSGKLSLSLGGTDGGLYTLARSQVTVSLTGTAVPAPAISTLTVTGITKSTAKVAISTNSPGTVYYMYALYGTTQPPYDEVGHLGPPPYDRTRSKYGVLYVPASHYQVAPLSDLQALRDYTFFAYFVSLMGDVSEKCWTVSFKTQTTAAPAKTTLRFKQAFMNDFEVAGIRNVVGLILSLADWQISTESIAYTSAGSSSGRLLSESDSLYSLLTLAVVDNPFNDNYVAPSALISRLATSTAAIAARVNNFDASFNITATAASYTPCEFNSAPVLKSVSTADRSLGFSAVLRNAGTIYAIAVLTPMTAASPLPWQVAEGLSALNVPVAFLKQRVDAKEVWNATVENLLPDSSYVIHLTCGNLYPSFPEMPIPSRLVGLATKTQKTPYPKVLAISSCHLLLPPLFLVLLS